MGRKAGPIAVLGVFSFLTILAPTVFGQSGGIGGTILTSDGGPVQNAVVVAKNQATTVLVQIGRDRAMMTECNGLFQSKHCSRDGITTDRSSSGVSAGTRVSN